jgi:hypothetical protein
VSGDLLGAMKVRFQQGMAATLFYSRALKILEMIAAERDQTRE